MALDRSLPYELRKLRLKLKTRCYIIWTSWTALSFMYSTAEYCCPQRRLGRAPKFHRGEIFTAHVKKIDTTINSCCLRLIIGAIKSQVLSWPVSQSVQKKSRIRTWSCKQRKHWFTDTCWAVINSRISVRPTSSHHKRLSQTQICVPSIPWIVIGICETIINTVR